MSNASPAIAAYRHAVSDGRTVDAIFLCAVVAAKGARSPAERYPDAHQAARLAARLFGYDREQARRYATLAAEHATCGAR